MKPTRTITSILVTLAVVAAILPVTAQEPGGLLNPKEVGKQVATPVRPHKPARRRAPFHRTVIPPMTVLHNPEYLSGEASVTVAANSNPLIRIGMAQNGVTLVEFPAADKFFAVHAGNSDLVTVEKSPTLKRDHHLILRAGTGFLVPGAKARAAQLPATSIIAQTDSGMAITLMIYPVPLLKQQAHRLVISYNRAEVITARRAAGLAINLVGPEVAAQSEITTASPARESSDSAMATITPSLPPTPTTSATGNSNLQLSPASFNNTRDALTSAIQTDERPMFAYREQIDAALNEAVKDPARFKKWAPERHGLMIAALPPRDLGDTTRLVVFAVRNTGREPLRLVTGYPDLYVETLNEKRRPVEAGIKIAKYQLASSAGGNLIQGGETRFFALAYEAPILGARQHLKIVVAHMSAADEPAMADVTAVAK